MTFQPEGCRQQDSCIHPTDSLRQKRCRIARRRRPDRATSRPGDAQGEDRWVERGGGFGHQLRRYPLTVRWPFGLSLSGCRSEIIAASLPASVTLAARLIRERVGSPAASHEGHRDAVTGAARRPFPTDRRCGGACQAWRQRGTVIASAREAIQGNVRHPRSPGSPRASPRT